MSNDELTTLRGVDNEEGAQRVFREFFIEYRPVFTNVETYLGRIIKDTPEYAKAYRPWQKALHCLSDGLFLAVEKHQIPQDEEFIDALKMFSFDGAAHFLEDISTNCKMTLGRDWSDHFHTHVEMLTLALTVLHHQPQLQTAEI